MAITKGPLNGIRVIDMTHAHAGPFGTMLLADLGAEIIKLETPAGELMRLGDKNVSVSHFYFTALNRNKKGLVLDLKSENGRKAFDGLVRKSDVVYSNNRAGVPTRQGTDFETLKKINPGIIRCNISGYGETGPYKDYPSFDIIACGHSGILSVSGDPKTNTPVIPGGIALADMMGGIFASMSVLAALFKRNRDGKGAKIEFNLMNGLLVMQQVMFQNYFLSGNNLPLQGQRHSTTAAYGIFHTKDGYITLAPINHEKLFKLIGVEHLLDDPKFKTRIDRIVNRLECNDHIDKALKDKTTEEWVKLLRDENDIPCGPVLNFEQIMNDPQVQHNKLFIEMELKGEKYKTVGSIFRLYDELNQSIIDGVNDPPPSLGEHSDEILKDMLDYSDEQINVINEENEAALPRLQKRSAKINISDQLDELTEKVKKS